MFDGACFFIVYNLTKCKKYGKVKYINNVVTFKSGWNNHREEFLLKGGLLNVRRFG